MPQEDGALPLCYLHEPLRPECSLCVNVHCFAFTSSHVNGQLHEPRHVSFCSTLIEEPIAPQQQAACLTWHVTHSVWQSCVLPHRNSPAMQVARHLRHLRHQVSHVISRRCTWCHSRRACKTGSHHRSLSVSPSRIHLRNTHWSHTCSEMQGRHSSKWCSSAPVAVCTSQGTRDTRWAIMAPFFTQVPHTFQDIVQLLAACCDLYDIAALLLDYCCGSEAHRDDLPRCRQQSSLSARLDTILNRQHPSIISISSHPLSAVWQPWLRSVL